MISVLILQTGRIRVREGSTLSVMQPDVMEGLTGHGRRVASLSRQIYRDCNVVFRNTHTASRREAGILILGCFYQPSFGAKKGTCIDFTTRRLSWNHTALPLAIFARRQVT